MRGIFKGCEFLVQLPNEPFLTKSVPKLLKLFFYLTFKKEVIDRDPYTGVPVNNSLLTGTLSNVLAGHASGCWHSDLGAGVPYNRKNTKVSLFL